MPQCASHARVSKVTGRVLSVTKRTSKLLQEIETGALDGETPIGDLLRRVIALGGQAGSAEMRDWATRELRGYEGKEELPPYRVIAAPLEIDAALPFGASVRGQQISSYDLPEFAREAITEELSLRMGIAEVEQLAARAKPGEPVRLQPPEASTVALYWNAHPTSNGIIERIYWSVSPTALQGIVGQVRTTLTVMVAEINATQRDGEVTSETATNAILLAVSGKRNTINLANAQGESTATVNGGGDSNLNWWTITFSVLGVLVAVAAGVFALMQAQGWRFG
jgi:hypothetical protein